MSRTFCLYCGQTFSDQETKGIPCPCGVSEEALAELERQERAHLDEYAGARLLTCGDLKRTISTKVGSLRVDQWLGILTYPPDVFKECAVRATGKGLIQLVYRKYQGSQLHHWPWGRGAIVKSEPD